MVWKCVLFFKKKSKYLKIPYIVLKYKNQSPRRGIPKFFLCKLLPLRGYESSYFFKMLISWRTSKKNPTVYAPS